MNRDEYEVNLLKYYGILIAFLVVLYMFASLFDTCKKEAIKRTQLEEAIGKELQKFNERMEAIQRRIKLVEEQYK